MDLVEDLVFSSGDSIGMKRYEYDMFFRLKIWNEIGMASFQERWYAGVYAPLNLSGIPGYPNENPPRWAEHLPRLCGDTYLVAHHVVSFMDYISKLNVEHEDVTIIMFSHSLMGIAYDWFHSFGKGEINSFAGFVREFCKYWDSSYKEQIEDLLDESISLNEDHVVESKSEEFVAISYE